MSTSSTSNEADDITRDKPPTKYLLLLDINGALCHRMTKRAANREKNDFRFKTYHVYRRPNFASFIEYIDSVLSSSAMEVYFYTSIVQHNAKGMIKRLLPRPEHSHYQDRIFDRSWNAIRPTPSEKEKSPKKGSPKKNVEDETMRDLNKIWKRLPEFDVTNTIIVDNSADKCENCMENSIIIPPFVDQKALTIQEDDTLIKLEQYLTQFVDDEPTDVRIYLHNHPFNSSSPESLKNDTKLEENGHDAGVSDVSKPNRLIQSEAKPINESNVSVKPLEKNRKDAVQSCLEEFEQLDFEGSST